MGYRQPLINDEHVLHSALQLTDPISRLMWVDIEGTTEFHRGLHGKIPRIKQICSRDGVNDVFCRCNITFSTVTLSEGLSTWDHEQQIQTKTVAPTYHVATVENVGRTGEVG